MYHQFNNDNSTFCPHSAFMCFVWIWEQTATISLYSINWLVFITETECVYCAVRMKPLNFVQVNFVNLIFQRVSIRKLRLCHIQHQCWYQISCSSLSFELLRETRGSWRTRGRRHYRPTPIKSPVASNQLRHFSVPFGQHNVGQRAGRRK
jgi:hypothetical protein